jgi:prepilin-type N-terminal cleavage/methylation domain-containing protein
MRTSFRDHAEGFSLVEVLFALAIVGLILGTAATVFRNGISGHAGADDVDTAIAVAEQTMAAAGITAPLQDGETHGLFADRFAWRLAVSPYDDKSEPPPPAPFKLYRLQVEVAWHDGQRQRQIALGSLRLAVAP